MYTVKMEVPQSEAVMMMALGTHTQKVLTVKVSTPQAMENQSAVVEGG